MKKYQSWGIPLLLISVALFLRLYQLGSVPLGISGDELFNAIDARQINSGNWPVFFAGNNGREALYFYLIRLSTAIFGETVFAIRLPSALLGTGTVLLAYLLGKQLFAERVGWLAGGLTAVSLWPLMHSRFALRAVSLTFFTALTIWLWQRAWQTGSRRDWLLGGVALGFTLYTYIPSRAFPLVLLIWLGWLFWAEQKQLRQQARSILLGWAIAFLIFAPFGWYIWQNPAIVNDRVNDLTSTLDLARQQNDLTQLWPSVSGTLSMFSLQGDNDWRYHFAEQPVFDPLTSLFFYGGIALALWGMFRTPKKAEYALLFAWMMSMLGPNLILEANPSFLRASGAIVPVYLLTAVAAHTLLNQLRYAHAQTIGNTILIGGLLVIAGRTWHDYFNIWQNQPDVRAIYQSDLAQVALYLEENPAPNRVYIARRYAYDLAPRTFRFFSEANVSWVSPDTTLPYTQPDDWLIWVDNRPFPPPLWQSPTTSQTIPYTNGETAFVLYNTPQAPPITYTPQTIQFENGLTLTGYTLPAELKRGETIDLLTYWQIPALAQQPKNDLLFVQATLQDTQGNVWATTDSLMGFPPASWQTGDQFGHWMQLTIPAGMPPGGGLLVWHLRDDKGILLATNDAQETNLLAVRSQPLSQFTPTPEQPVWADTMVLREALLSTQLSAGLDINLALDWVALQRPLIDYQLSLQLRWGDEIIVQQTNQLWPELYPPSQWEAFEPVRTLHQLAVPLDIPTTGEPTLHIELLSPTNERVPLTQGSTLVTPLSLVVRERLFEQPTIAQPITAQFADHIRLLGYDLSETSVTLYWQAIDTPTQDYTVFVHVMDEAGNLLAQFDAPPAGDAWLTSTWLPDEIIIDERAIHLPENATAIWIGWYDSKTAVRLPATQNGQAQPNEAITLPLTR